MMGATDDHALQKRRSYFTNGTINLLGNSLIEEIMDLENETRMESILQQFAV